MSKPSFPPPWSVSLAVHAVPAEGRQHHLEADAATRAALAKLAGVVGVGRLAADVTVVPRGTDGLHVTGRLSATVDQTCVVTLEPMQSELDEAIDLLYLRNPPDRGPEPPGEDEDGGSLGDERIEALDGDSIDLGAIVTEFLLLGIDPYPRKPEAMFAPPAVEEPAANPFAALAALRKAPDEGRG